MTTTQTETMPQGAEREEAVVEAAAARRRSPWFVLRRTVRELLDDGGIGAAASLAFVSLLASVSAAIALLGLVGVVGQASDVVRRVLTPLVEPGTLARLDEVSRVDDAWVALGLGLLGLLGSAGAYVAAFGRAMNRAYEVEEGRPWWWLRPLQAVVTLAVLLLVGVGAVIVAVTGPVARAVGDLLGLSDDLVVAWDIAKWPVLGLLVMALVALLHHVSPNVAFSRFRPITVGACVAILVWVAASVGVGFYVVDLGSYDRTYAALAGLVVLALWLWLTNLALLLGGELDAELERGRQLQRGLAAEERLVLRTRSDRATLKRHARRERDLARMRAIREAAGGGDPADRPFDR